LINSTKTSARERVGTLVLLVGLVAAAILGFASGQGILAYIVIVASLAICAYLYLPRFRNTFLARSSWFQNLCVAIFAFGYLIAVYLLLVPGSISSSYVFMSLSNVSIITLFARKALQAHGKVRNFFLGYAACYSGMLINFLNQLLVSDSKMRKALIIAGTALFLCGLAFAMFNRQGGMNYWVEGKQKQMDPTNPDAFSAEQLNRDQEKEM
jgi:hypothetical protein